MKELKRISAFFMAMLMMLTVFSAFSVVSAEGEAAGGTQPVWPAPGSIKLNKDAAAVEGETNLWEVTLGIQGKNFETTSDVVLVIDCSGSMEGTKLTNTRKAAKAFGQKLLTEGSTTRIAIVTFINEATAYNNGHFYDATELSAFEAAVDAATYANGGTNQQAGIHKAQELLNTSSAGLKNIVILSDGEATFSHPFAAAATYANCEAWTSLGCPRGGKITNIGAFAPDYTAVIGSGSSFTLDYNARVTATCPNTAELRLKSMFIILTERQRPKAEPTTALQPFGKQTRQRQPEPPSIPLLCRQALTAKTPLRPVQPMQPRITTQSLQPIMLRKS